MTAPTYPWCKWRNPDLLINLTDPVPWCGDGEDQLAGNSINWIQFWAEIGETNWICPSTSRAKGAAGGQQCTERLEDRVSDDRRTGGQEDEMKE